MIICKTCEKEYNYDIQSVSCPHDVLQELCQQNNIIIRRNESNGD